MRAFLSVLCLVWLCLPAWSISPHRLSLQQVLKAPHRIARVRLLECSDQTAHRGHRWHFRFLDLADGKKILELDYFESWPYEAPDGKLEAPIYTGSGLEQKARPGEQFQAIYSVDDPAHLLRLEPDAP